MLKVVTEKKEQQDTNYLKTFGPIQYPMPEKDNQMDVTAMKG
jgi:hypothetical protein